MTAGRRGLRVALVVMLAALGAAAAASAAGSLKARSVSASAGTTAATATYDEVSGSAGAPYANLRLAIVRDGRTLFDAPVKAGFCGTQCWPDVWPGHGFLRVADIESNGSPDVVLDLYSGGAHCCSIVEVYRFDAATGAYGIVQHNFWDPAPAWNGSTGATSSSRPTTTSPTPLRRSRSPDSRSRSGASRPAASSTSRDASRA